MDNTIEPTLVKIEQPTIKEQLVIGGQALAVMAVLTFGAIAVVTIGTAVYDKIEARRAAKKQPTTTN